MSCIAPACIQSSASHGMIMGQMKGWWAGQAWSDSKTLLKQGEGKWLATSSDCRKKNQHIQQCTGCQKTAEERRGGRRRHGDVLSKKIWKKWVSAGMELTRSSVTVKDRDYSSPDAPRGTGGTKAVSTRHFSELGAIDRAQSAPSCPCPHGGNWNARSGS